ncbi:MAG: hypothetical protein HY868_16120 [Chloroflexi bacterium]|nr:hypothetical protein [Chloroflexota bacterium]
MTALSYRRDARIAQFALARIPKSWDGKKCVLQLKAANFNWRQMEWWAFYFELLCQRNLGAEFTMPGD